MGGSWNYAADGKVGVQIDASGHYQLSMSRFPPAEPVTLPFADTEVLTDDGSVYECEGFGTTTRDGILEVVEQGRASHMLLEGQVDLTLPKVELKGRLSFQDPYVLGAITTVEWNITREAASPPSP
jgi:hypothetical protein